MNINKLIFRVTTVLLALMYLGGASRYFLEFDVMSDIFVDLGYPRYLHPIMGVTKFMAVFFLLAPVPRWLKEWTYAGIFINATLALIAHMMIAEPFALAVPAVMAIVVVITSRVFWGKLNYPKGPFKF